MKKWTYNIAFKTVCVFIAVVGMVTSLLSAAAVSLMLVLGGYEKNYEELYRDHIESEFQWLTVQMASLCRDYANDEKTLLEEIRYYRNEFGMDVVIRDASGEIVYADELKDNYDLTIFERVSMGGEWYSDPELSEGRAEGEYSVYRPYTYSVTVCIEDPQISGNMETGLRVIRLAYAIRLLAIPIFVLSLVLTVASIVFLCCAAGRRGDGEAVVENFFDRLYLELYLILALGLVLFEWILLENVGALWLSLLGAIVFLFVDSLLIILFILTLSTRIKSGNFYSRTFTYRLFRLIQRGLECVSLVPKIALTLVGVAVFDLFLATVLDFTEFLAALLIEGLVLMGILIWYGASIERIRLDQVQLSKGNMEHRCDPTRMPPGLRSFGEEWNRAAEGMEKAVEEKMKSERFKTELITNVSHDIKTPLTSIINYVDLIKKENVESERVREYLEVLERQSARLKKLTEDLVESSKAASGVIRVELTPLDVSVLLEQALGEYGPKFDEKKLMLCPAVPEHPTFILADGKHLWRVLDNLMNNICKYALEGTRVYCSVESDEARVKLIFRNISAMPLSVGGEDLAERFVRGDSSRNTEGSGLGLAIARSLTELQKGKMEIFVDGDLFRVTLTFDRLQ